jgi:hypothetical protein
MCDHNSVNSEVEKERKKEEERRLKGNASKCWTELLLGDWDDSLYPFTFNKFSTVQIMQ